ADRAVVWAAAPGPGGDARGGAPGSDEPPKVIHKGRAGFSADELREALSRRRSADDGDHPRPISGGPRELSRRSPSDDVRELKPRLQALVVLAGLIFLSLIIRLFQLPIRE